MCLSCYKMSILLNEVIILIYILIKHSKQFLGLGKYYIKCQVLLSLLLRVSHLFFHHQPYQRAFSDILFLILTPMKCKYL